MDRGNKKNVAEVVINPTDDQWNEELFQIKVA